MKDTLIKNLVPLSNFTSWRIGGLAEWFAEPKTIEEIEQLIEWANDKKVPVQSLGAGSNVLISDKGLQGLTICLKKLQTNKINDENGIITVLAGEPIPTIARRVAKSGISGLEWSAGIPGTIGGAVVMNAGAKQYCIADKLISAKVICLKTKKVFELNNKELSFGYRDSRLQHDKLIVLSAKLKLSPNKNPEKILKETYANITERLNTQPYHLPSCGSVFRNPEPLKAGALIENLGLKGTKVGGAEISKIHANFIVNTNKAKAKDIEEIICLIQRKVQKKYGFLLFPEVKKLGFDEIH